MFGKSDRKEQAQAIPEPDGLPPDVIVSPDTRLPQRVPPGQSRTRKWPVLDASGPPEIEVARWRLRVSGQVNREMQWTWDEFAALPRVRVFSDFHCVTRWSRLGNLWEGVSTRELIDRAGGARPDARYVLVHDALVAVAHDGEPIGLEHGGPARLIVPRLYAWKSAQWVAGIGLLEHDRPGFWEANGYHMHGDPWKEERFGW